MKIEDPDTKSQRVVVVAPNFIPAHRGGGPIRSIAALVACAPSPFSVYVATSDRDWGQSERLQVTSNKWLPHERASVYYCSTDSVRAVFRMVRQLRSLRPDIMHLNSFLNPLFSVLFSILNMVRYFGEVKLLLSPRGEFGSGALSRRALKKKVYIALYRALRLHKKVIWHSTGPEETRQIEGIFGTDLKVVERQNDVLLPLDPETPADTGRDHLSLIFLSRIVEHKGLHIILDALRDCSAQISLDIYGSREDESYVEWCEGLAKLLPANVRIEFHPPVEGDRVLDLFRSHDALVLPTAGENFGHVIAEALSSSCPAVVTPHTPWTEALQLGGGIVVPSRDAADWAQVLQRMGSEVEQDRVDRRLSAGRTYQLWRALLPSRHLWELASEA